MATEASTQSGFLDDLYSFGSRLLDAGLDYEVKRRSLDLESQAYYQAQARNIPQFPSQNSAVADASNKGVTSGGGLQISQTTLLIGGVVLAGIALAVTLR